MCCNKRRQAGLNACGGYGTRSQAGPNIASIIGSLQQIRLGNSQYQQRLPASSQMPRDISGQSQGVIYPSVQDEKHDINLDEKADFEELPSYEASTGTHKGSIPPQTLPAFHRVETQEPRFNSTQQHQPSHPTIILGLQHFNTGLEAYRQGDKKSAKRAAKSFVKELYAQEVERRRSVGGGYLECGERKQIKRELHAVKREMKEAVREAKMERRMQRAA